MNDIISLYESGLSIRKIALCINKDRKYISKVLKRNNIKIRYQTETSRRYYCDENYFHVIDSQEKAYWLGFIAADGYLLTKRERENLKFGITLSSVDKKHLELFNKCIKSTYEIKTYSGSGYNKNGKFVRLIISSNQMVNDLRKYSIIEHKTGILKFPNNIPNTYYKDFVRGYIDGNGSIFLEKQSKQWRLSITGSYDILYNINLILKRTNKISKSKNIWEVKYGGNKNVLKLLSYLYDDATIKLERKYGKYIEMQNMLKSRV